MLSAGAVGKQGQTKPYLMSDLHTERSISTKPHRSPPSIGTSRKTAPEVSKEADAPEKEKMRVKKGRDERSQK